MRQLGLAAALAGHQRRRRSPSSSPGASGCCCATSSAWERPRVISPLSVRRSCLSVVLVRSSVLLAVGAQLVLSCSVPVARPPQGRPPGVHLVVPVLRVVREPRPALGAQTRAVVPAQRLQRQCEHHRVPQRRLEVDQVTRPSPAAVGVVVLVALRARRGRRAPGGRPRAGLVTGSRQRTHSPDTVPATVPETSTPSTTDSSRRSSSSGDPPGRRARRRRDGPVPEQSGRPGASTLAVAPARGCRARGASGGRGGSWLSCSLRACSVGRDGLGPWRDRRTGYLTVPDPVTSSTVR